MRHSMNLIGRLGWAVCCAVILGLALRLTAPAADWWENAGVAAVLSSPSSSQLLAKTYPRDDVRLDLVVRYSTPGVVVDTVGINAAAAGDWQLQIRADGCPQCWVYAPKLSSPVGTASGWHIFSGATPLTKNEQHWLTLVVKDGDIGLLVDGQIVSKETLPVALSGNAAYLGDFPGDDHWGSGYNIHPACQGIVRAVYFGPFHSEIGADALQDSVVQPDGVQTPGQAPGAPVGKFHALPW
jgi:hypothetical protein